MTPPYWSTSLARWGSTTIWFNASMSRPSSWAMAASAARCGTIWCRPSLTLLDRDQRGIIAPLRRIVIETTGLADPAPLVFTVVTDPMLQHHFRIDSVVTTVDAVNGPLHLDRHPVSRKQVALADEIIITKTDLALPDTVATLRERLRRDNPAARLTTAVLGDLDPQWLLDPQASHPTVARTTATVSPELLQMPPHPPGAPILMVQRYAPSP